MSDLRAEEMFLMGASSRVLHVLSSLDEAYGGPLRLVLDRKAFALVGAGTAFLVAFIAYYSPLWPKEIGTLMPVLRDRFWLVFLVVGLVLALMRMLVNVLLPLVLVKSAR